jgi:hypothetical protein
MLVAVAELGKLIAVAELRDAHDGGRSQGELIAKVELEDTRGGGRTQEAHGGGRAQGISRRR